MSLKSYLQLQISTILQKRKSAKQLLNMNSFVNNELKVIDALPVSKSHKAGTLIVKCDDIGDFLVWQQVIATIQTSEKGPVYFVGNKVIKGLYEQYFDFADKVIWIDKSQWQSDSYRKQVYDEVRKLNAERAYTTLFTRNYMMDDLMVMASDANEKIAWSCRHHTYFPDFDVLEKRWTQLIESDQPVQLEYFRNLEFVSKVYHSKPDGHFKPLFPNFNKHNTLVVVPVASAGSKTWKAEYFASCIQQVKHLFDRIILLGGANSKEAAQLISQQVNDAKLINLVDQTKLHELFAFIGEARVLLSVDTFAAHMGPLCCTDTVVVANGTNWQRFGDYEGKINSEFKLILPPHFKKVKSVTKVYYSSSEIQEIQVSTVVDAINSLQKKS